MKARKLNNLIATALIGAILVGCSGGGTTSTGPGTTIPRASTNPTTNPSPVAPTIGSGPITVGMSGNEAIDDVNTKLDGIINKQNAQSQKMDEAANKLNEINSNSQKAASNSSWAKWLGVAAVSMLALPMIYNGIYNYGATGDIGKALGATFTNSSSEADSIHAQRRQDSQTSQVGNMIGASTATSVAATQGEGRATRTVIQASTDTTGKEIEATREDVRAVGQSVDSLSQKFTKLEVQMQSDREAAEKHRLKVEQGLSDANRTIVKSSDDIKTAVQQMSENELKALQKEMAAIKPQLDAIPTLVSRLDTQKTELEKFIAENQTNASEAQKKAFSASLTEIKNEIAEMNKVQNRFIEVQSAMNERLGNLASKVATMAPSPAPVVPPVHSNEPGVGSPASHAAAAVPTPTPQDPAVLVHTGGGHFTPGNE